ncbi:hypothetical protein SMETP3_43460 [Serratia marcescens]|nr:hypothetical protein SMETP3_43460 [Serratia marcescens]
MIKHILFFFTGLIASYGYASPYPIVSSVTSTIFSTGSGSYAMQYEYTESVIDIGSAGDMVVPNQWPVGIAHKHYEFKASIPVARIEGLGGHVKGNGVRTISDLAMEVYRAKKSNVIYHSGYLGGDIPECLGYVAAATGGGGRNPLERCNVSCWVVPGCSAPPAIVQYDNAESGNKSWNHFYQRN